MVAYSEKEWAEKVFPKDQEEFEESVIEMRKHLRGLIFNDLHRLNARYFLSGEFAAYKILDSWYKDICSFKDVYSEIDRITYMEIATLIYHDDLDTCIDAGISLLDKTLPYNYSNRCQPIFAGLWLLKYLLDEGITSDGIVDDNFSTWSEEHVSYDKFTLLYLCSELQHDIQENDGIAELVSKILDTIEIRKALIAYMDENS